MTFSQPHAVSRAHTLQQIRTLADGWASWSEVTWPTEHECVVRTDHLVAKVVVAPGEVSLSGEPVSEDVQARWSMYAATLQMKWLLRQMTGL